MLYAMLACRRRLKSRLSRVPFPLWALAVCLLAAIPGAWAFDDYGVYGEDPFVQRETASLNLDYALGRSEALLTYEDRYYGVAFELPLLLAERALGLADSRSIYLLRYLLTHLFFIAGAFFAALLAYRMTGHRGLALFALLLFLLHPRLYAHSFVNSKDLPFLSMLMIALYFTHRAFRRDTLGAFIVCGVAVGLLSNIRIMGLMLFPAVIALRGLDLGYEFRRPERCRHLLLTTAGFAAAAALALYAAWPWLWGDPLGRLAEGFTLASNETLTRHMPFRGEIILSTSPPWDYLPVWMSITTPPATLLLGLAGAGAALYGAAARPGQALRNGPLRFELLLLAGLILPVIAVIALDATLYSDWRHLYFLYAPLGLLAAAGLQRLVEAAGRVQSGPRRILGGPRAVQAALYAAAAVALLSAAGQMLQLHPFQNHYFNFLVDRRTPEYLSTQYTMRYWPTIVRPGLEQLLERYPDETLRVYIHANRSDIGILTETQRQRLAEDSGRWEPFDFFITQFPDFPVSGGAASLFPPPLHTQQVYHNTIYSVAALDASLVDDAMAARYRQRYREAVAGELLIDSEVAVYRQGRTLSWVIESCNPREWGEGFRNLWLYPADQQRVSAVNRPMGFNRNRHHPTVYPLARFDGRCFAQAALPEYELARLRASINRFDPATGQKTGTWVSHYYPGRPEVVDAIARRRESEPPPAAGPQWEVYQDGARLLYAKVGCVPADREMWFFLHLTPAKPGDLPGGRREHGYDNWDFQFDWRGLEVGEECIAVVPLPDYPITAIATGQYTDAGRLWETTLPLSESNSRPD